MYHIQIGSNTFDGSAWTVIAAVLIAIYLMQSIAYMGIFKKAEQKKDRAWVPFLNAYTQYKISWSKVAFIFFIVCVLGQIVPRILSAYIPGLFYFSYITNASAAGMLVLHIIASIKLAKSFGRRGGFAVGLIFLPQIFMLTLGIGNSEYVRNK